MEVEFKVETQAFLKQGAKKAFCLIKREKKKKDNRILIEKIQKEKFQE